MKYDKERLYSNVQGLIGDMANANYSIQWQRLSQMQQSASILLAILAISISLMFNIVNVEINEVYILDNAYWKKIFIPGIINYLLLY